MSFNFKALSEKNIKSKPPLEPGLSPEPYAPKMLGLKFAIIFSFLLSFLALSGAGVLFNSLAAEKQQRESLESSHAQLQQKAEVFEKSASSYKSDMEKIQAQLQDYAGAKKELAKQLEESRSQINDLRSKIKNIQEKNQTIEETAADEIRESGSETALNFSSASAQTGAAGTAASKAALPAGTKDAKVLSVNRKFNFAVVNIGLSQKLKIGDPLEVVRDGKTAARLQVEKLYEGFCAASITQESKDAPVKEGDTVKQVS